MRLRVLSFAPVLIGCAPDNLFVLPAKRRCGGNPPGFIFLRRLARPPSYLNPSSADYHIRVIDKIIDVDPESASERESNLQRRDFRAGLVAAYLSRL
jgi:hypothetical protein